MRVSAVHVVETHPPEDETALQWFLLTTLKVTSAQEAAEIAGYYLQRWRIEDFSRVLKSGCRVEFLLFRTADRWCGRSICRNCRRGRWKRG